ncbi:hypothetical protein QVD17_09153 [Tagetes erecta]|uniref:Uncharacterized protein n=1 Tax=Tagetes erecta TaxID=13708 RepID=A0AAD8P3N9_TARER|nr:hypothetical protein QVD17_09153 [Tagetes erecta]
MRGRLTNTTVAFEEYMRWYLERTVTFRQGMSQVYQMPGYEMVNNLAGHYMDFSHADHEAYLPGHVMENPDHVELPPVLERLPRRARGRGRGRGRVGVARLLKRLRGNKIWGIWRT